MTATTKPEAMADSATVTDSEMDLKPPRDPEKSSNTDQPSIKQEGPDEDAPVVYPSGFRLFVLVTAVLLTVFLTSLDQVRTAIPKITNEFRGIKEVLWYGAAYFMTLGGFQSSWGKAYKFFPLKSTFILSVIIFEIGSLICAVAPNPAAFIVGRAIAGVGGAGCSTGGAVILTFSAEPKKRPTLLGMVGFSYTIAAIFGPLIGGGFSDNVTWRWCFYINLPIGGLALVLLQIFFKTPANATVERAGWKEVGKHMDPVGVVLMMGGIISFILALQYAGVTHSWRSSEVVGLLVGFVVIFAAFGMWEVYQGEYAAVPWRLLKTRSLGASSVFQFFFAGCYFLLLYYLPIYFQSIKGEDAIQSGVDNLPLVIAGCLAIISGGITVTKTGISTPFMAAGAALATVATGLMITFDVETPAARWIGYQILAGVAIAFPFQNALNTAQAGASDADMSTVTAILLLLQILGGAFSVSAAQSAFANRLLISLPTKAPGVNPQMVLGTGAAELSSVFPPELLPGIIDSYLDGLKAAFAVATGMAGVSFLVVPFVPWKRLHRDGPGEAVIV
ncbi:hypothetical protein OQA88_1472 [Cercophora sp. LCS_1]